MLFFLQLYDWKATTQVGNSQVHSTQSHRKASLIGFVLFNNYLVKKIFCYTFCSIPLTSLRIFWISLYRGSIFHFLKFIDAPVAEQHSITPLVG